ncbi:MAG: hypothetical protein M3326_16855 [Actinomycetota bacterium]|nr:hypothetical protein [Actinomycetota bacterium]
MARPWWTKAVALLALPLVLAACGGGGDRATGRPGPLPPANRPSLAIEEHAEALVDTGRSTDAVGTTPASPSRSLPTVVLTPAAGQPGRPYPLIVFAHGNGGRGRGDHPLLRAWASAGYVVAAPTFPFGAGRAPEGEGGNDYPNQPGDMSFVIGELLRRNGDPSSPLYGAIDPDRVGAAGHSLGATTTLALAANTCCHDDRVKAAVILAGGEVRFGSGQFWARIRTPVLFVHGDADPLVAYTSGQRAYDDAPPPRFLLTIPGGDHTRPYSGSRDDPQARVVTEATLDFFDQYLKGVPDGVDRLRSDAAPPVATLQSER